jgi:osmotically-inducible protein OsmY
VLDMGQVSSRIESKSLAGHVVLLGVVASPEAVADAQDRVRNVKDVTGVTNFLLVPEEGYESLRPHPR